MQDLEKFQACIARQLEKAAQEWKNSDKAKELNKELEYLKTVKAIFEGNISMTDRRQEAC